MDRRGLLASAAALAALGPWRAPSAAKPARIVVGFPAGAPTDLLARIVTPVLEDVLQTSVVVDNKPGAGGRFAPREVDLARAADDLVFALVPSGALTLLPLVYKAVGYSPTFAPIAKMLDVDMGLAASPLLPVKTFADLREYVRTPAGRQMSYASSGVGSALHFLGVAVSRALGVELNHVPYTGPNQVLADLSTGTLQLAFGTVPSWTQLAAQNKLRILAIASPQRDPKLPDLPTFREVGVDLGVTAWYGLVGRAGMPRPLIDRLAKGIESLLAQPRTAEMLKDLGRIAFAGPDALAAIQSDETALWRELVRVSGFKAID